MRRVGTGALAAIAALLAGCASAPRIEFQAREAALAEAARELEAFAREGWHLPLRVRVFLSNAEGGGRVLEGERRDREVEALRAQLAAAREAYAASPFDVYAIDLRIDPDAAEPEARFEPHAAALEVRLPAPDAGEAPAPLPPEALLDEVTAEHRWDRDGRWYAGERTVDLTRALGRDLLKLIDLERELGHEAARLELLAGTVLGRAAASESEALLTPSETEFARAAQVRAFRALHRALNTLARWRLPAQDPACSLRREALLAAQYARYVVEGALDRLLETLVGGRALLRVWAHEWRHRNPLYKALDAEARLVPLGPGRPPGRLPAGSVRGLLALRLDGDLGDLYGELDARWVEEGPPPAEGPLAGEVAAALTRLPQARAAAEADRVSRFSAWKELWDARLKEGVTLPFNQAVEGISRFLGHTRWAEPPPRIDDAALARLEGLLRPGDIVLVRQDLFLSNAFLPGFWPHAMIYLGPPEAWGALPLGPGRRLKDDPLAAAALAACRRPAPDGPARVIEAVSDGVVLSSLRHAVQKDFAAVLRPLLAPEQLALAIRRALALRGRPYDFEFDFASDDAVVCTEVVYRAFDPDLAFRIAVDASPDARPDVPGVTEIAGRLTMPAQQLARYAVYMTRHPAPDPATGYPGRRLELVAFADGPVVHEGEAALTVFEETLSR